MPTIVLNGSITLDETAGLQNGTGTWPLSEDNNDNDIAIPDLPTAFSGRLSNLTSDAIAGAASKTDLISVTLDAGEGFGGLNFSLAAGGALPVYGGADPGVASGLTALDGGAITLFSDVSNVAGSLGSRMVLGVDTQGDIVFALYLGPGTTATKSTMWMASYEPIQHPVATNPDDGMTLGGLGVAASTTLSFNFNALPSGQNLFGTVGTTASGLVVIGKTPVLNADGTFTNASNTINTSQGGGPTTIGINNQMFDPGDGAYFTYVKNPVASYLAGAPNGLDQNEADDADFIQYTGGNLELNNGFTVISQTQGNASATMKVTAFNMTTDRQGQSFATHLGTAGSDTSVNDGIVPLSAVRIYDATGTKIAEEAAAGPNSSTLISFDSHGVATVSGLGAGYKVEWDTLTANKFDQVLIEAVAGKFDIGGFGSLQGVSTSTPLNNVHFEDDGPSITATIVGAPTLTVDESAFGTDATAGFAGQFKSVYGADGAAGTPVSYALSTVGGLSGLIDTATGETITLSLVGGAVQGSTTLTKQLVFSVSVDGTGSVSLDQSRAIVHPDATKDNETKSMSTANLVVLTATAKDGDNDTAPANLDITAQLVFHDDGPSISSTLVGAPTLTVDETNLLADARAGFAGQFKSVYGADGSAGTPVSYALSTPGGLSGLIDTATGETITLSLVGGAVQGSTTLTKQLVFSVSVDGTGSVTLDQSRAIVHPDATKDNETKSMSTANLVVLTATAKDGDNDTAPANLDITAQLVFHDDGPSISSTLVGAPTLTVDETNLLADASAGFAGQFKSVYGADGSAGTPVSYALSTPGGLSGLIDTATGETITLSLVGGAVQGSTTLTKQLVFSVSVDGTGSVTLDQSRAIVHPDATKDNETKSMSTANLVVLTATAKDGDNDTAPANLDITAQLVFHDDGPSISSTIVGAPTLTVDETNLLVDASAGFAGQFKSVYGADGSAGTPVSYALSTPGGLSGLIDTATGETITLSLVGGAVQGSTTLTKQLVFSVSVDGTGSVTLDQSRAIVHPDATKDNETKSMSTANLVVLTATAKDGDNDTAPANLDITAQLVFHDDGPSISSTLVGAPTLTVDETNLLADASAGFAGQFKSVYGADGSAGTPVSYALSTAGGPSGLIDTATGETITLSLVGGAVQGSTSVTKQLVFSVSVDSSGSVTLDQSRSIVHPDTKDSNETKSMTTANLVVLTATAKDGDNDTAPANLDITAQLVFRDDGPGIGPVPDSIVDFVSGATVTKSLLGVVGNDPNSVPYTITAYTSEVTVNGVQVKGVLASNSQQVTYYADTNKDSIFGNTGDTAYYRLSLTESGAGSYTFDVLTTPPPANLEFNFNALPSGQNLFGTVGTTASGLVVIGKTPVLNADGTFTNASNTINTSQGGGPTTIGINNQMFDPGDGAYFTYVKNPVASYLAGAPNGLDQNEADDADFIQYTGGNLELNNGFTVISQTQGNASATMKITAFNMSSARQGQDFATHLGTNGGSSVPLSAVRVYNAAGTKVAEEAAAGPDSSTLISFDINGVATVSGLGSGYKVEWDTLTANKFDQVLIEADAGKFDIGGFGAAQAQPTPDQKLDFTVQVTDGDSDTQSDSFSIGIDGTGTFDDGLVLGVVGVPIP